MKRILFAVMLVAASHSYAAGAGAKNTAKATWQKECSACHIAYPARFLSAADWKKLMGRLDRHFGDNATVDAATAKTIEHYLVHHAGRGHRHNSRTLRISDTPWFTHEHRELPRRAWTSAAVKSASNCAACHINAAHGDWSEHGVLLPAGIHMEDEDDEE